MNESDRMANGRVRVRDLGLCTWTRRKECWTWACCWAKLLKPPKYKNKFFFSDQIGSIRKSADLIRSEIFGSEKS